MAQIDGLQQARYAGITWNAPLSDRHATQLLDKLSLSTATSIIDLGCGWGELLLQAVERGNPDLKATGVDTDVEALARGKQLAQERGLDVSFLEQRAEFWHGTADRALCIGSSHTLGGTRAMLDRLATLVPAGRVLIGDTCWERPPHKAASDIFGDGVLQLSDIAGLCREAGWKVLHLSTASQQEWDDFESGHRAGPRLWLLANPNDPRAAEVNAEQDQREHEYLTIYRGVLSFVYLVLAR